jgi:hypothetical protein
VRSNLDRAPECLSRVKPGGLQTRPKNPRSLTLNDEVIILAYRWRTRLWLDESLLRLVRLMPQLSRSALYRCLEQYGLSKIGRTNISPPLASVSLAGPFRFEITADHVDLGGLVVRVLPVWSLNFRKRSTPLPRISVRPSHM